MNMQSFGKRRNSALASIESENMIEEEGFY
jgi:hypothetical protein